MFQKNTEDAPLSLRENTCFVNVRGPWSAITQIDLSFARAQPDHIPDPARRRGHLLSLLMVTESSLHTAKCSHYIRTLRVRFRQNTLLIYTRARTHFTYAQSATDTC